MRWTQVAFHVGLMFSLFAATGSSRSLSGLSADELCAVDILDRRESLIAEFSTANGRK